MSTSNDDDDKGLVWFITGTSSGFGRRLVLGALSRGDRVIATARNPSTLLSSLPPLPPSTLARLHTAPLDLTSPATELTSAVHAAIAGSGWATVDVLVNNGGTGMKGIVEEGTSTLYRTQFEVNFFAHVDVTCAVLPLMRARKSGTVVLMGSRSAWRGELTCTGAYAASKAAMHVFGETLAAEVAGFGIRVLIVQPAGFRTEGILGQSVYEGNKIGDYNEIREDAKRRYQNVFWGAGDPGKAVAVILDVVRGEGVARGRDWPLYLPLGEQAAADIMSKIGKNEKVISEWRDVITNLNIET